MVGNANEGKPGSHGGKAESQVGGVLPGLCFLILRGHQPLPHIPLQLLCVDGLCRQVARLYVQFSLPIQALLGCPVLLAFITPPLQA